MSINDRLIWRKKKRRKVMMRDVEQLPPIPPGNVRFTYRFPFRLGYFQPPTP